MIFSEPLLFAICMVDTAAILFLLVYYLITLSDLECDYLNAQQCCAKLNTWVGPKIVCHGFASFLLLIHGQWLCFLLNIPMSLWMSYEILLIPKGNIGVYDPTEIHNRGQLKKHMRDCMINLGFYLILFFIYLYCLIIALLKIDPLKTDDDNSMPDY
ncbi:protein cornichon homolog 4 [Chrysoperla carnea]|uniref:protein cornichon homolog 4 n=1 Tax=Chrysoperla carnea TaxID=189513 RepID=UPI001D0837B8|nr:protein cornichon homolog 4 [Chrysoperla carnea]